MKGMLLNIEDGITDYTTKNIRNKRTEGNAGL